MCNAEPLVVPQPDLLIHLSGCSMSLLKERSYDGRDATPQQGGCITPVSCFLQQLVYINLSLNAPCCERREVEGREDSSGLNAMV